MVVVPDNEGEGGEKMAGVSGVSDVRNPPQPSRPRKIVKPKPVPDSLKRQPKIKAKPRPTKLHPPTHSGVSGVKRKNSRSPSAGAKRKAVRLEAASASSAPSHSGVSGVASANYISLQKPLEG